MPQSVLSSGGLWSLEASYTFGYTGAFLKRREIVSG